MTHDLYFHLHLHLYATIQTAFIDVVSFVAFLALCLMPLMVLADYWLSPADTDDDAAGWTLERAGGAVDGVDEARADQSGEVNYYSKGA